MNLTVAITGASGAIFGREILRALEADDRVTRVYFVASENSLRVLAEELSISGRTGLLEKLLDAPPRKTTQLTDADVGASIASGSHPSAGTIILPCSMGTLAAIANGLANSLIARAADVALKEHRPLLLCVRETPFNRIHLRNMTLAAEAGAVIFPVSRPSTTSPLTPMKWPASLSPASSRTSAFPSPERIFGRQKSSAFPSGFMSSIC